MSLINCAEPDLDTIELIECDCVSGSAGEDGIHSGRHDRTEEVRRPSSRGSVLRPAARHRHRGSLSDAHGSVCASAERLS